MYISTKMYIPSPTLRRMPEKHWIRTTALQIHLSHRGPGPPCWHPSRLLGSEHGDGGGEAVCTTNKNKRIIISCHI